MSSKIHEEASSELNEMPTSLKTERNSVCRRFGDQFQLKGKSYRALADAGITVRGR